MGNPKIRFKLILLLVFAAGVAASLLGHPLVLRAAAGVDPLRRSPVPWLWAVVGWFGDILPKIGDALLIAPILAIVVDGAAKQNLLTDFARDVSTHIIGRYLPRELREHINGYLTVDIVRLDLDVVYTLKEEGDAVILETVMTSDLHNYSQKEIDAPIFISLSKSLDTKRGTSEITEVTVGNFTYREGDSTEDLAATGIDNVYTKKLKLAPSHHSNLPHGTRCIVKTREFFGTTDQTAYFAVHPVIGATVTCMHPPTYDVILDLTSTQDNVQPPAPETAPGRSKWIVKQPILQGQGLFLKWARAADARPFGT